MLPGASGRTGVSNAPSQVSRPVLAHHPSRGAPHLQKQPDPPGPRSPVGADVPTTGTLGLCPRAPLPPRTQHLGLTAHLCAGRQPRPQDFFTPLLFAC